MKQQSLAKGFAILSAAGIIVKILSLLYVPFLIAIIGDEGYGIYGAANQVYVFVYVLANSGMPVAISKLVSELVALENHKDAIRSFKIARFIMLAAGLILALTTLLFAHPLSNMVKFNKSALAIMWLAPSIMITAVASAYRGYFQGRGNMTPTAVSQIIEQVINAIFTVVFAAVFLKHSLEWACAGGAIGTLMGALSAALFLVIYHKKRDMYIIPSSDLTAKVKRFRYGQLVRRIIYYSLPITLCVGMQYAGNLIDLWNTKSRLLAAGLSDVQASAAYGFLLKYQQLLNAPIAVTVALATALLPAISAAVARKNSLEVEGKVNFAFRACFLIALPSAVGFSVLSIPIFRLLHYGEGEYLMKYGSFILILMAIVQIQTSILQGAGKLYATTFYMIIGIVGKVVANYFLIAVPKINILGAVMGSMVGFLIPIALNIVLMKRTLNVGFNSASILKPAFSSIIMGLMVFVFYYGLNTVLFFIRDSYLFNAVLLFASIIAGGGVYFTVLAYIKGLNKADLDIIPNKLKRLIPKKIMNIITQ
ncbi:MAG TPA: polysaccharide biosynthesis protein [Pseudobacteroides sp.]|uniref:putative polysaccharide biosynthesis protein n=1 Tax=Pseudobacteroides sp. TaxID=1968840 RepID=UPI002F93EF7E